MKFKYKKILLTTSIIELWSLLPRVSLMTQQVKNPRAMQETQEMRVRSLYIRDTQGGYWILQYPLEEEMATTVVFLREKPHGQRSLVCYSPVGHEELDMTE